MGGAVKKKQATGVGIQYAPHDCRTYPIQHSSKITSWCAHTSAASIQLNCHPHHVSHGLVGLLDSPGCDRCKHTSKRGSHISVTERHWRYKDLGTWANISGKQVTLLTSPSARYCACWMLKKWDAQKIGNSWGARDTAVPALRIQHGLIRSMDRWNLVFAHVPSHSTCSIQIYRQYGIFLRHRTDR